MPRSDARTPHGYLEELPPERREVVSRLRELILNSLPAGYQERVAGGMLSYEVPLERYPGTYNGQPLAYLSMAAQKHHFALYLMGVYLEPERAEWLASAFAAAGRKLDLGKSCLRFRRLEDLALPALEELIASTPPERFIQLYEAGRAK